tara:strand:- start:1142 stop:2086 length:945 start_codon:yes stop_codon:yes gene_type:complete
MEEYYKDKRVLVTGGGGFIGSHLVKKLISLKAKTSVLVRKTSDLWRLEDVIDEIKVIRTDFENTKELREVNPEIVFNLMADTNHERDPEIFEEIINNNYSNTVRLIRGLEDCDLDLFVQVGTCEEYGDGKVPFNENQKEIPVSPYSLSKVFGSHLVRYLNKIEGFPIVGVRPFLTYGPMQVNDMLIPSTIRSLFKEEKLNTTKMEQTRDLIYVDDVVSGFLKVGASENVRGEIINIGSGKETSIKEVVETICKLTGRNVDDFVVMDKPYRKGEAMHFYCSNEKAKRLLDWEPETSLGDGLKKTVDWYRDYLEIS